MDCLDIVSQFDLIPKDIPMYLFLFLERMCRTYQLLRMKLMYLIFRMEIKNKH